MSKAIFKKWWFWLIVVLMVGAVIGATSDNDPKEETQEEAINEEVEETNNEDENNENEENESVIEEHDDMVFGEFSLTDITTEVTDDEVVLTFSWLNQSGRDTPFISLGLISVTQGDEVLEETSGAYDVSDKSNILFKNANGGPHKVTLVYKLENRKQVEIAITSTLEFSDEREAIKVDIP